MNFFETVGLTIVSVVIGTVVGLGIFRVCVVLVNLVTELCVGLLNLTMGFFAVLFTWVIGFCVVLFNSVMG